MSKNIISRDGNKIRILREAPPPKAKKGEFIFSLFLCFMKTNGESQDTPKVIKLRRGMRLAYLGKSVSINPWVLLDTGAEVSCLRHSVFEELKLAYSVLKATDTTVSVANGCSLETFGPISLKMACYCYKQKCQGLRIITFHVIKDLVEQVLILNEDCQQLGLTTISSNNQAGPKDKRIMDHPNSFNALINNLFASLLELGN